MWILSFFSILFFSHLSFYLWCVWCDTQSSNHPIYISLLHFTPLTLLSFTFSFHPSSHYCVAVCGWVSSILSSSYTSFLGEGANALGAWGGNSPARRRDRGEKLLISRSSDNFPVCAEKKFTHKHHRPAAAGFHHENAVFIFVFPNYYN